jgi:hypothetical protein
MGMKESQEALLFVNKKKQKNFVLRAVATSAPNPAGAEVFWFFFSKKNRLLPKHRTRPGA